MVTACCRSRRPPVPSPRSSARAGWAVAAVMALGALVAPSHSRADAAAADALFEEGRRLMGEKRHAEACAKFEGSYREEATLGTLLNLANCREIAGQLATAWARWGEAEARARQAGDDRASLARERRDALVPRLPKLTVVVINPRPGLTVLRDDTELAPGSFGSALPTDPGTHVIQVVRADGVLHRQELQLAEGQQLRVELDLAQIEAAAPREPPKREPVRVVALTPEDYDPGAAQRTAGWVTTGFGGAALVAGFVLGGIALGEKGSSGCVDAAAGDGRLCPTGGVAAIERAETLATAGQWVGIAGAVVAGVGLTLVLTAPDADVAELERRATRPPTLALRAAGGPSAAGVSVGGAF